MQHDYQSMPLMTDDDILCVSVRVCEFFLLPTKAPKDVPMEEASAPVPTGTEQPDVPVSSDSAPMDTDASAAGTAAPQEAGSKATDKKKKVKKIDVPCKASGVSVE